MAFSSICLERSRIGLYWHGPWTNTICSRFATIPHSQPPRSRTTTVTVQPQLLPRPPLMKTLPSTTIWWRQMTRIKLCTSPTPTQAMSTTSAESLATGSRTKALTAAWATTLSNKSEIRYIHVRTYIFIMWDSDTLFSILTIILDWHAGALHDVSGTYWSLHHKIVFAFL